MSEGDQLSKDEWNLVYEYRRKKQPWRLKINKKVGEIADKLGMEYRIIHLEWMSQGGNPQAHCSLEELQEKYYWLLKYERDMVDVSDSDESIKEYLRLVERDA
jgi:hypothetical protein